MKSAWTLICFPLMVWLTLVPAHAAEPTEPTAEASAKAKAAATAKAKPKPKPKAKAKAKAKAKP